MAIWLDIKKDAKEIELYAREHDVFLLSEKHFHLHPDNDENRYIRLGFAGLDEASLTRGLEIIFNYFE